MDTTAVVLPIILAVVTFGAVALFLWIILRAQQRERELLNRERVAALERGIDLPPDAYLESRQTHGNSLKTGLVALSLGVGFAIALALVAPDSRLWAWGVLAAGPGVGHLLYWVLRGRREYETARSLEEETARAWVERVRNPTAV